MISKKIIFSDKITIRPNELWVYLFVAFSIYFSGAASASVFGLSSIHLQRLLYFIYIFIGLALCYHNFLNVNNWHRALGVCGVFALLIFAFNLLSNPSSSFHLFIRVIWLLIIFSICYYNSQLTETVIHAYFNLITLLAFFSIIAFIAIVVFHPSYSIASVENGNYYYKYFGFYYVLPRETLDIPGISGNRMQAIFWEPGVFAVHLALALYIALFLEKKRSIFNTIVLLICLFLTYSTTGIIVGVGVLGIYLLTSKKFSSVFRLLIFVPVVIIAIYIIMSVWSKKSAVTLVGSSYGNRMADLYAGFQFFIRNIVWGSGYNNDNAYALFFQSLYGFPRGSSNGLLTWMYSTGLVGTIPLFYPFIRSFGRSKISFKNTVFIFVFFLLNMTEPLITSPVMMFLVSYEYYYISNDRAVENFDVVQNNNL